MESDHFVKHKPLLMSETKRARGVLDGHDLGSSALDAAVKMISCRVVQ